MPRSSEKGTATAALTILALIAFAGNSVFCRLALAGPMIDPASYTAIRLIAVAMVTTVSLFLMLGFVFTTGRVQQLRMNRSSFQFFLGAALVATSAQVANFVALGRGQMSIIIPLLNTTPLFTVFFSALFLRRVETVNRRIVCGAILMVGGVVLITSR